MDVSVGASKDRKPFWRAIGTMIFFVVLGSLVAIGSTTTGMIIIVTGLVLGSFMLLLWFLQEILNGGVYVSVELCKCALSPHARWLHLCRCPAMCS